MNRTNREHLRTAMTVCRELGAEVRGQPEDNWFTAMVWDDQNSPELEERARSIQREIQRETAQYPGLVCYCFDPFSTLVYTF